MKKIVVLSATRFPLEDRRAIANVISFISDSAPDEVVQIGDMMDYPSPQWPEGSISELASSVSNDSEYAKKSFLEPLRKVYSGPMKVIEGEHDLQPREHLEKHGPDLADSEEFHLENMLDFDGFGIDIVRGFYDFAPDWVMTHGHLGLPMSNLAGRSAMRAANKIGKSVVLGHTHRMGISSETFSYRGKTTTRTGVEVGHLMDTKKADYLKTEVDNRQKGFAIVHVDGGNVTPEFVPARPNGSFVAAGSTYGDKPK